jgi:YVTN family beta-propeller protein
MIIDVVTNAVTGSVKVGERPWGIALSPDGKRLYTANGPSNDVSVVDTETLNVVGTIKVGQRPWGVTVAPAPTAR